MTKKQKRTKYLYYTLILVACDLLQNVGGLFPQIDHARCFLLLPAAIILAMGEDEKNGAFLGLFAGLLWDLSSGVHTGFNSIFIMVMCFFSAALVTYIARDTFLTNMIAIITTVAIYCIAYWLLFIVIKDVSGGKSTLFTFYLPCFIYTSVVSPILWLLINPLKKKYKNIEKYSKIVLPE